MEYVGRAPAPPLDEFIDDIYCLTGVPRHRLMNVPPMPSAHLFCGACQRLVFSKRGFHWFPSCSLTAALDETEAGLVTPPGRQPPLSRGEDR